MSHEDDLKKQFEDAKVEVSYLKRRISRMEKRLLRQEKIDDMNRHQSRWAMRQMEQARALAEQASQAKTDFQQLLFDCAFNMKTVVFLVFLQQVLIETFH